MGNHLGPLPEASDGTEGQEQPVWAIGGQGELRGVTRLPCKLEIWDFLSPCLLGLVNHLGTYPEDRDSHSQTRLVPSSKTLHFF